MEQQRTVEALWQSDGLCACGRPIRRMDEKMCIAQVNSSWCVLTAARNTLAIGIYCAVCADRINVCLKTLKALPERDKLKSLPFTSNA
jgi:hypothetical protein